MATSVTTSLELPVARETHTDPLLWAFTLALGTLVTAWMLALGWTVLWGQIAGALLPSAFLAALGRAYTTRDARLARICYGVSLTFTLFFVGEMATYVAGVYSLPFLDDRLAQMDHWLGFDWATWTRWVERHRTLDIVLHLIYPQHLVGTAFTVLWLAHRDRANPFLRAITLAFLVAVAAEVLLPAVGTILDAPQATDRMALRAGTFHAYDVSAAAGLISMPSFHAVLAVLMAIAWWPSRVRWLAVAFNAVLLVSTLSVGGHYLVDVLAGIALAVWAARVTRMGDAEP